jgi:5-hydroxyisourate hydrolase-like protein (transthyretin family)
MKTTRQILLAAAVAALVCAGLPLGAQTPAAGNSPAIETAKAGDSLPCVLSLKPPYTAGVDGTHKGYLGRKTVDGLPFDVSGESVLDGKCNAVRGNNSPKEMTGVKVGRKFDELHLLHSVQWSEYHGCPVALIRLHYTDGSSHDFQIRYGVQVRDWNRLLSEEQEIISDPDTKIIWRGEGIYQGTSRLFKSVLRNPSPDKPVDSLDVISTSSRASYVLNAATVAKSDPQRAVTPALPLEPSRNFDGVLKVTVVDDKTGAPMAGADVYPSMSIDGDGVVADPILTDSNGVVTVKYPVSQTSYAGVEVSKDGYAEQRGNWQKDNIPEETTIRLETVPKITGVVRTPNGQPAAGISLQLVNSNMGNNEPLKTDAQGKFEITWNVRSFGNNEEETVCLLARDAEHNLAVAQEVEDPTAPLKLTLAPALTLFGRAEAGGKPLTNVSAQLVFWSGNRGMWLPGLAITNTPGKYEIPALPPGRKYGIIVSAPGYGQKQNNNLDISAEPGRQELDPVELKLANLKLAGQVLGTDDQPVTDCYVNLYGEDQPSANVRTDKEGRFAFKQVCEGTVRLSANAQNSYGNISAEGGDTNVVLKLGENMSSSSDSKSHKLKGVVTDTAGQPAAGAQVAVFPNNGNRWTKTGANGEYSLTWMLQQWQMQNGSAQLVVRDKAHNLAAAEELSEEVTNLNVTLKPALTLTGQVKNEDGTPLPAAQIGFWLKSGNSYEQLDQSTITADASGHFEIKCLPMSGEFIVWATAKGYGKHQQPLHPEYETNRVELEPFALKHANLVIAGQVLKDDDKPASGVNVNLNGDGQPDGNLTTDSQGRFHFQVCEGQINLNAYSQNGGGNAQANVQAGDTNIVMNLTSSSGGNRAIPRRAALKGGPLPDLTSVNLVTNAAPAGQPVLLCLFDAGQRPSRHVISQLNEQAAALKEKKVCVIGVQAAVITDEAFNAWKDAKPVSIPLGRVQEKSAKTKWATSTSALPWLVLTDANYKVVAEGFPLDELDAQIQKVVK